VVSAGAAAALFAAVPVFFAGVFAVVAAFGVVAAGAAGVVAAGVLAGVCWA